VDSLNRNQDIYLDFVTDPSLAAAFNDYNPGDKCTFEVTIEIKSKDMKGLSGTIEPGSVTPEGYEREEPNNDSGVTTPAPQPPGSFATAPVTVAMNLRKKNGK
jgi:hypothetical protein